MNALGSKKFVFVNRYYDPDESATSQMLSDLAQAVAARGLLVHVVCSRQLYLDAGAQLSKNEARSGVTISRVGTTRFGRAHLIGRALDYASFHVAAAFALFKLLRRRDVLIAKTDPPLISVVAAVIARAKGVVLINWQQDVFPEVASHLGANPLPQWLNRLLQHLRDMSLRSAAMNVLLGERMCKYFQGRGIPHSKLCVIENWANAATITPKPSRASELRAHLGIEAQFVVCYSGNLGRAHEFDTLLAAADSLRADPSILFLIIGGGARMELLQRAVAERQLSSFRFAPYQPRANLADSLAAGDLHLVSLLPALEGLIIPSKLYGILAAGRPLIFIGDVDGEVAHIIAEARCGVSVNVNAGRALVEAIGQLRLEPNTCAAMGERARKFFLAHYTLDDAVEKWMTVLDVNAPGTMS